MKRMKSVAAALLCLCLCVGLCACSVSQQQTSPTADPGQTSPTASPTPETQETPEPQETVDTAEADKAAADRVAALIDAIYVQRRDDDTDELCAEAKAAWDALTDAQKALVEGVNADPDYFGRDTGDASLDDPRNADGIGKKELLVVSFGTSFNESRALDIRGVEDALQEAFPDWDVRRAFTAQIIINHVQSRDGEMIDNMDQALERAVASGVEELVVLPTHLMHGAEYDELVEAVERYRDRIPAIVVAEPLLGPVGTDGSAVNADKQAVAEAVTASALADAGFGSMEEAAQAGVAFVLLGHGTSHTAKVTYTQMQTQMELLGYSNVFVGTVEGEPEETSCEAVIEAVRAQGYGTVILRPLMVVAGDHAYNDMAGEDAESWLSQFQMSGAFDAVEAQIAGLGRIGTVQTLYIAHAAEAVSAIEAGAGREGADALGSLSLWELPDGVYSAKFDTDSGMFHVSEACDGRGVLTVSGGTAVLHVSLSSESIQNLYLGLIADVEENPDLWLYPTKDTVTYADGTQEVVNGFDIPVPVLGEEFDCALLGKKGTWYDHKVSVSGVQMLTEEEQGADAPVEDAPAMQTMTVEVTLSGGSGKAKVESPCTLELDADGQYWAIVVWGSKNYEFMLVGETRYDPIQTEGNSTFRIPVTLDVEMAVSAQTVAMGNPHLVDYTLYFDGATVTEK